MLVAAVLRFFIAFLDDLNDLLKAESGPRQFFELCSMLGSVWFMALCIWFLRYIHGFTEQRPW